VDLNIASGMERLKLLKHHSSNADMLLPDVTKISANIGRQYFKKQAVE